MVLAAREDRIGPILVEALGMDYEDTNAHTEWREDTRQEQQGKGLAGGKGRWISLSA